MKNIGYRIDASLGARLSGPLWEGTQFVNCGNVSERTWVTVADRVLSKIALEYQKALKR